MHKVYSKQLESDLSGYFHLQISFTSQAFFLVKREDGKGLLSMKKKALTSYEATRLEKK